MDVKLIMLLTILLLTLSALAQEEPTASPTPEIVTPPESTYVWQKRVVHSDLSEEWNKLAQGIAKLQKAIDDLTETVDMFSKELGEEIDAEARRNEIQTEPNPSPTPESNPSPTPE